MKTLTFEQIYGKPSLINNAASSHNEFNNLSTEQKKELAIKDAANYNISIQSKDNKTVLTMNIPEQNENNVEPLLMPSTFNVSTKKKTKKKTEKEKNRIACNVMPGTAETDKPNLYV